MNIIKKIKAFFIMKGKQETMDLTAAEIRQEGVFLHPADDPNHTYFVKTDEVEIHLKPSAELREDDIFSFVNEERSSKAIKPTKEPPAEYPPESASPAQNTPTQISLQEEPVDSASGPSEDTSSSWPRSLTKYMPKKKRFAVMLYPDEYDVLMKNITDNGYKKAEYFLACMTAAKKQSMVATYKRYTLEHAKRHKDELIEAKRAREADQQACESGTEQSKES